MIKRTIYMKKAAFFLSVLVFLSGFSGCTVSDKKDDPTWIPPQQEEPFINSNAPVLDGSSSNLTQELIDRLETEEFTKPKNIILMIGDGMGFNSIRAAKLINEVEGNAAMEHLPIKSSASTYSTEEITDSAAAATALATGFKTENGKISVSSDEGKPLTSVLEVAADTGMKTGVIATKNVTDATPAGFTAHTDSRSNEEIIATQQLEKLQDGTLDLLFGGGSHYFTTEKNQPILDNAIENGLNYVTEKEDAASGETPILGLFDTGALYVGFEAETNLAFMTQTAIDALKCDEGFFLMVEGSQIDTSNHSNNEYAMAEEFRAFDAAVEIAMRFVAENPDTVLIVTADHETGGISLPDGDFNEEDIIYTTTGHTGVDVPLFAIGYGTQTLLGGVDNTDIAKFIAELMGNNDFGRESDREYINKLKNRVSLSAYLLDIPINDALTEYIEKAVISESRIATTPSEAEQIKQKLDTIINCDIPFIIKTKEDNEEEMFSPYIIVDITVMPGTTLLINGVEQELSGNKFSGKFEKGKDIIDFTFEFTLRYREKTNTIKHLIFSEYSAFSDLFDLSSEKTYDALKNISSNNFENKAFKIENNKLYIDFSKGVSRFTIPADSLLTGKDFSGYNGIRITYENTLDHEITVPSIVLSSATTTIPISPSQKTVLPQSSATVDYFYNTAAYGENIFEDIRTIRIIAEKTDLFTITNGYVFYKN